MCVQGDVYRVGCACMYIDVCRAAGACEHGGACIVVCVCTDMCRAAGLFVCTESVYSVVCVCEVR